VTQYQAGLKPAAIQRISIEAADGTRAHYMPVCLLHEDYLTSGIENWSQCISIVFLFSLFGGIHYAIV
jgi:hypothetical protein